MEPNSQKPTILPAVITEVGIVGVLLVFIVVTLNYFNILSLSSFLPFLPHQQVMLPASRQTTVLPQDSTPQQTAQQFPNQCRPLPASVKTTVNIPTSSVSAELAAFSGTWMGKWDTGNNFSSVVIVRDVTPKIVTIGYFLNGVRVSAASQYTVEPGNKLLAPSGLLTWEMGKDGLHGTLITNGKPTSKIVMTRCTP